MHLLKRIGRIGLFAALAGCKTVGASAPTADANANANAAPADAAIVQEVDAKIRTLTDAFKGGQLVLPQRQILGDSFYRGKDFLMFRAHQVIGCVRLPSNLSSPCEYSVNFCDGPRCTSGGGESLCNTISGADGFFGIFCVDPETKSESRCPGLYYTNAPSNWGDQPSMVGQILDGPIYLGDELTFALPKGDMDYWVDRNDQSYFAAGVGLCDKRLR